MPRFRIVAFVAVVAALYTAPAIAQAAPASNIATWTSSGHGMTLNNASYLISYDNPTATMLTVTGTATGLTVPGHTQPAVDIVCYFGPASSSLYTTLATSVPVTNGAFSTSAPLQPLAGHACRLRAVEKGGEAGGDLPAFAGPQIAVAEAKLPLAVAGHAYDFLVTGTSFTGFARWSSAGSCGPSAGPFDSNLGTPNPAVVCMGSLLGSDRVSSGTRSEVQVDGQNAYDAASIQTLFQGSENFTHFPSLTTGANWDPTTGLVSSEEDEGWVACSGAPAYPPTTANCPDFLSAGVSLHRSASMSDGGQVVTITDTWSSADGRAHSLDLLYDDLVGLSTATGERGYQLPGQSGFTAYGPGATVPGSGAAPASTFVRTNLAAADGDPAEAAGAITFSHPPADFRFAANNELEEHQLLQVPAGGSTSLTYIYSTAYAFPQAQALGLAAQDRIQAPALTITAPAGGATMTSPEVTLTGTASAGSGITSLAVGGRTVPVGPGGAWTATVPLNPGSNTITATATDGAGAGVQAQVGVVYQAPVSSQGEPTAAARCHVPRTKGMKLAAAERTLRRAHCRVGRVKRMRSRTVRRGRVMSTTPAAGRWRAPRARIEIFVSKGT